MLPDHTIITNDYTNTYQEGVDYLFQYRYLSQYTTDQELYKTLIQPRKYLVNSEFIVLK